MNDALVFIVEQNEQDRNELIRLMNSKSIPCRTYNSGERFLDEFDPGQSGCLISAMKNQGMSGLELQTALHRQGHHIPTILTTEEDLNLPIVVGAMRNGAVDVLKKPLREFDLWTAIQKAIQLDEERRSKERQIVIEKRKIESLTEDEERVLQGIMLGKANKTIASELDVSIRTIESRRHNIFKKTETESVAELVQCVMLVRGPMIDFDRRSSN